MARPVKWFTMIGSVSFLIAAALGWWWTRPLQPAAVSNVDAPRAPSPLTTGKRKNAARHGYDTQELAALSPSQLAEFEAWVLRASCQELVPLFFAVMTSDYGPQNETLAELMLRRLRDFPGEELLAAFQAQMAAKDHWGGDCLTKAVAVVSQGVLPQRQEEVLRLIRKLSGITDRDLSSMMPTEWLITDFEGAKAFFHRAVPSRSMMGLDGDLPNMRELYFQLAKADVAMAQERVASLPRGPEKFQAMDAVAACLVETDFETALPWLQQQEPISFLGGLVWHAMTQRAPAAAAALVAEHPGWFEHEAGRYCIKALFQAWVNDDSAAAKAWLEANPLGESFHALAEGVLAEAEFRRLPLAEALAEWSQWPKSRQEEIVAELIPRLAREDPSRALDRLAEIAPVEQRVALMVEAIRFLPAEMRVQLFRWLPELVETDPEEVAKGLAYLPPEELERALASVPEAKKRAFQRGLLEGMLDSGNSERVLEKLPELERAGPDESLDPIYSQLAWELGENDPQRAAHWVAGFPEGSRKEWMTNIVVELWGQEDPGAATAWVENLPAGASRDHARVKLASLHGLMGHEETALRLAAGVQDETQRREAYVKALGFQAWRDSAAAQQALATAVLSPEAREHVRQRLQQHAFRPGN